jgi:hypothetical protein
MRASRCVACAVHSVKRSRSATGTPIISQITVDGHRQREVGDHVHLAARGGAIDQLVVDRWRARAQALDRTRA